MVPSAMKPLTVRDRMGGPPTSRCFSPPNIACMIDGTPAMTKTLPIWKPGAVLTGLSIRLAPCGTWAMRSRASLSWPGW